VALLHDLGADLANRGVLVACAAAAPDRANAAALQQAEILIQP
jgi:hypothetical protein